MTDRPRPQGHAVRQPRRAIRSAGVPRDDGGYAHPDQQERTVAPDAPPLQVAPQRRGIPQGNEGVLSTQGRGLGLQPDKTYYMGTPHPQGRGPAPKEGV